MKNKKLDMVQDQWIHYHYVGSINKMLVLVYLEMTKLLKLMKN